VRCNGTSLKRGAVGPQRFKESAVPGTYWGDDRCVERLPFLPDLLLQSFDVQKPLQHLWWSLNSKSWSPAKASAALVFVFKT